MAQPEEPTPPSPQAAPPIRSAGPGSPPPRTRWLRVVLLSVLGLFAATLVTVLIVGFFVDLGGVVSSQVAAQLPKIEEQIGRKVRVGRTKLTLLPKITLQVSNIAIEAAPGQTGIAAQPLLIIDSVRARVAVWPALVSFGRRLEVDALEVNDLKVQVVRGADGHLSYEDILEKLASQPDDNKPLTQDQIDQLGGITVTRAALRGGAVSFFDLSTPYGAATPIKVDQIDFTADNVRLFHSFPVALEMAVLSASQNFHFGVTVGPLPSDLQITAPLSVVRHVELKLQPLQIEPLMRFLPPTTGLSVQKTLVEADVVLDNPEGPGDIKVATTLKARGLVLEDHGAPAKLATRRFGTPTDLGVSAQLTANLIAGDVKLDKFEVLINSMAIKGNADLRSLWTSPAVNALALKSSGLLLEQLVTLVPPSAVPQDATLRGPISLSGTGSGTPTQAKVEVALDATAATLQLPTFNKPAGTPLVFEVRGQVKQKGADIDRLGLTLGPLALLLSGQVRSANDFDLKVDTGRVDLDRLLRLLPTVEKSMSAVKRKQNARIAGDLRVFGTVKRQGEQFTASTKVQMRDAELAQGDIELRGAADLSADLRSTPSSAGVDANLDLTSAGIRVPGSVAKGAGVPMRVRLQADRTGNMVNVKLAQLELPGGTVQLVGSADMAGNKLNMKVPLCDLDLAKLSQVVPALSRGTLGNLMDSKIHFAVSADGNPNKLATVRARVEQFSLQVAGGTVRGTAEVIGLDEPRKASFDFSADNLDLDKILPPPSESESAESAASSPTAIPKFVKRLELDGKVNVATGKLRGAAVRDFKFELAMAQGKLTIKALSAAAFGGNVVASGSTVDFNGTRPKFNLKAKLSQIEVAQVLALRSPELGRKLSGKGNLDLSSDGQGLSWEDIAPKLNGTLGMALNDGQLSGVSLANTVIGPLLSLLGGLGGQLGAVAQGKALSLRSLAAQFRIDNGRLRTTSPIHFNSEEGGIVLTGSIGLDKTLDLMGELQLTSKIISMVTGGKLVPSHDIPVGLRVGGTLSKPEIGLADPVKTVAALTQALLLGRGADLIKGLGSKVPIVGGLGNVLGGALGGQPAAGQPATPTGAPPAAPTEQEAQQRLQEEAKKRLQQDKNPLKNLGGLFGR